MPSNPRVAIESLLMSANACSEGQAEDAFPARTLDDAMLRCHLDRAQADHELENPGKDLALDILRPVQAQHLDNAGIKEGKEGFKTEKQRTETIREIYSNLRSLLPNSKSNETDRASMVEDTILYIYSCLGKPNRGVPASSSDHKRSRRRGKKLVTGGQKHKEAVATLNKTKDGKELKFEKFKKFSNSEAQVLELNLVSKHGAVVEFNVMINQMKVNVAQKHTPRFLLRLLDALSGIQE